MFGAVIGSDTGTTTSDQHQLLSVTMSGIAGFRLTHDSDGGGFDNLSFDIPAPSSVIDFDGFSVGGGAFGLAVADRYRADGIVFDSQICIEDVAVAEPGFLSAFVTGGGTTPNMMALTAPCSSLQIEGTIVVPGTSIRTTTDYIQVDVFRR